jgi:hypothetical protein
MARNKSRSMMPESSRPPHQGRSPQKRMLGDSQIIMEQVVEKVASTGLTNYPILTKSKYTQWAQLMRIQMEVRGLWGVVHPGDTNFQVDPTTLDAVGAPCHQK